VGEQVVAHLRDRGIARVLVANRSRERGEELARNISGESVAWEELLRALEVCDMVVCSVGAAERVVTRAMVERAMSARSGRALFLIDLGVPRNVEPEAGKLYNVYLYDLDDLGAVVEQNKKARESEVPRVEAIVDEHVEKFVAWQASSEAAAVLAELRAKLHREGDAFVRGRLAEMPHLSATEKERFAQLSAEMLDRVVLDAAEQLKGANLRHRLRELLALRELFGLDKEKP
jgi:glutamyl-tRNA reductase